MSGRKSWTSVSLLPTADDTTVYVHEPNTHDNGTPTRLVAFRCGHASVQFDTPGEAFAWLDHCIEQLNEAL